MNKYLTLIFSLVLISSCSTQKIATDKEIDLYCQRLNVLQHKIEAISSNIVNINTTRTMEGGPYKRRVVSKCVEGICKEGTDYREPILKYEPKHPDANKNGYVAYPNISLEEEQYDQKRWGSIFADIYEFSPVKRDFFLNDPKAKMCFDKYPYVNESYNYKKYFE